MAVTRAEATWWKAAAVAAGACAAGFAAGWVAQQYVSGRQGGVASGKRSSEASAAAASAPPAASSAAEHDEDHDEDDDDDGGSDDWDSQASETASELALVPGDVELKMVFGVRSDLNMSKGKTAAQVGHAVLGAYKAARFGGTDHENGRLWRAWARAWDKRACAKITLKVDNEEAMFAIAAAAEAAGLPHIVIEDAGRTEIPAGTRTVVGIGPAPKALIDALTGPRGKFPLKLLA
jgi:PTH2 family peptidyl-tRNA hydrolase